MRSLINGCGFESPVNHQKAVKARNEYIQVYYQNVRGLRMKTKTFLNNVLASTYDLFAITESGLNNGIHDGELIPTDYNILRCDRADGRKQGGVFLAASPSFGLNRVSIGNVDKALFEIVCVTVHRRNHFLFFCCVVYIPPKCEANEYMQLFHILENVCVRYDKVLLLGDFNMPSAIVEVQSYLDYFIAYCGFRQVNDLVNINDRTLDLVLSTFEMSDLGVQLSEEPLVNIDAQHPPLVISAKLSDRELEGSMALSRNVGYSVSVLNKNRWNFNKADFLRLYHSFMLLDWELLFEIHNSEMALNYFYKIINEVLDECVPKRNLKVSKQESRFNYPEWYTSDLISDIKRKWRYHKLFKTTGSQSDYEVFSRFRARVKIKIASTYEAYQNRLQKNLKADPKSFWSMIRTKKASRNKAKVTKDGLLLKDEECAESFASYFHSVYSPHRPALDPGAAEYANGGAAGAARVHVDRVSARDLRAALLCLKPKRSVGPDGIPPYIVRDCRMVFEEPLLHIFNLCLQEGHYPDEWKITRVIPVPKGGAGSDVSGYRPVAVLSAFAKVFESVLHRSIYKQVSSQLTDAQHGFRPGRSTGGNLLSFVSYLSPAIDAGGQVDVAYFDFRKAFDTVDNDVLLCKLAAVGFTPHLLRFFASYLGERRQYVEYAGHYSNPYYTFSGVSQGSNIGPLEFILVVNDLPTVVKEAKCLLFADDLKLFLSIKDEADCIRLQSDINRVVQWSKTNKLNFNVNKCCVMSYSRARAPLHYQYEMDTEVMPRVTQVRDLGVQMVPELTFRKHIVEVCGRAFRNLGFILRQCKDFSDTAAVKVLYNALVRSHLETSAIIWNPHEGKYSLMLEKIQNKFTRFLYMKEYGVYPFYPLMYPSLFVLGMVGYTRLAVRRDVALVKYVASVLLGLLHHPEVLEALRLCAPDGCVGARRRPALLDVPLARTNLLKFTPMTRAIRLINAITLSEDIFCQNLPRFIKVAQNVMEKGLTI